MGKTRDAFANRCLPLLIANQAGWLVLSPHTLRATWDGSEALHSVRIEHLEGCRRYREFGDDFGHLYSLMIRRDLLTDRILDRFFAGYENLDIINWAMDWGLPVDEVIEVLVQLDMNRARLDP